MPDSSLASRWRDPRRAPGSDADASSVIGSDHAPHIDRTHRRRGRPDDDRAEAQRSSPRTRPPARRSGRSRRCRRRRLRRWAGHPRRRRGAVAIIAPTSTSTTSTGTARSPAAARPLLPAVTAVGTGAGVGAPGMGSRRRLGQPLEAPALLRADQVQDHPARVLEVDRVGGHEHPARRVLHASPGSRPPAPGPGPRPGWPGRPPTRRCRRARRSAAPAAPWRTSTSLWPGATAVTGSSYSVIIGSPEDERWASTEWSAPPVTVIVADANGSESAAVSGSRRSTSWSPAGTSSGSVRRSGSNASSASSPSR